jgi:hypothetical protein
MSINDEITAIIHKMGLFRIYFIEKKINNEVTFLFDFGYDASECKLHSWTRYPARSLMFTSEEDVETFYQDHIGSKNSYINVYKRRIELLNQ